MAFIFEIIEFLTHETDLLTLLIYHIDLTDSNDGCIWSKMIENADNIEINRMLNLFVNMDILVLFVGVCLPLYCQIAVLESSSHVSQQPITTDLCEYYANQETRFDICYTGLGYSDTTIDHDSNDFCRGKGTEILDDEVDACVRAQQADYLQI